MIYEEPQEPSLDNCSSRSANRSSSWLNKLQREKLVEQELLAAKHGQHCTRRSVRFQESSNMIIRIPRVEELTAEEREAFWYQPQEFRQMKSDVKDIVRSVRAKERQQQEDEGSNVSATTQRQQQQEGEEQEREDQELDCCVRGIEAHVYRYVRKQRNKIRQLAATAVFMEQYLQGEHQQMYWNSHERIAREYRRYTQQCQIAAQQVGLLDAQRCKAKIVRDD